MADVQHSWGVECPCSCYRACGPLFISSIKNLIYTVKISNRYKESTATFIYSTYGMDHYKLLYLYFWNIVYSNIINPKRVVNIVNYSDTCSGDSLIFLSFYNSVGICIILFWIFRYWNLNQYLDFKGFNLFVTAEFVGMEKRFLVRKF